MRRGGIYIGFCDELESWFFEVFLSYFSTHLDENCWKSSNFLLIRSSKVYEGLEDSLLMKLLLIF
jgi:hypothetical protein